MKQTDILDQPRKEWIPFKYQEGAVGFMLSHPTGGLLAKPGTGKTVITLTAFKILRDKKFVTHLLVLAPLRPATKTWPDECAKWEHLKTVDCLVAHGSPKKKEEAFAMWLKHGGVLSMNFEGLQWLAQAKQMSRLKGLKVMLAVDESTKVKNTRTQRFKILRGMLSKFARRHILTGTPAPNGYLDLFGQIYVLDQGAALGRYITHYRLQYFLPAGYGGFSWVLQEGAEKKIQNKLKPLVTFIDDDVLDLPPLVTRKIELDLPPAAMKTYLQLEALFLAEVGDKTINAVNAGALTTKLRQLANGGVLDEAKHVIEVHEEKALAVVDLMDQLQGSPLLVAYEFVADKDRLLRVIKKHTGETVPWVGGGVSVKKANEYFEAFNRGDIPALLGQPQSMAHGLNLQECSYNLAWAGMTWNLEDYEQFWRRIRRLGQKAKHVMNYLLIMRGTVDERIADRLDAKDVTQKALLEGFRDYVRTRGGAQVKSKSRGRKR